MSHSSPPTSSLPSFCRQKAQVVARDQSRHGPGETLGTLTANAPQENFPMTFQPSPRATHSLQRRISRILFERPLTSPTGRQTA
jgi:hypothetical protein